MFQITPLLAQSAATAASAWMGYFVAGVIAGIALSFLLRYFFKRA